jgi:hypothetical protein
MILFICFISLFALDSFEGEQPFIEKIGGFLIHLIPTAVLIILLIFSWRREWVGGIVFLLLAIGYLIMAWGKFPVSVYFLISGPLFIISVLFWVNWVRIKNQ